MALGGGLIGAASGRTARHQKGCAVSAGEAACADDVSHVSSNESAEHDPGHHEIPRDNGWASTKVEQASLCSAESDDHAHHADSAGLGLGDDSCCASDHNHDHSTENHHHHHQVPRRRRQPRRPPRFRRPPRLRRRPRQRRPPRQHRLPRQHRPPRQRRPGRVLHLGGEALSSYPCHPLSRGSGPDPFAGTVRPVSDAAVLILGADDRCHQPEFLIPRSVHIAVGHSN